MFSQFDRQPETSEDIRGGFFAAMTPAAARKQLRVSLAVAAACLTAALLAASIGQLRPVHTKQAAVKLTIELPGAYFTRQANAGVVSRKDI